MWALCGGAMLLLAHGAGGGGWVVHDSVAGSGAAVVQGVE